MYITIYVQNNLAEEIKAAKKKQAEEAKAAKKKQAEGAKEQKKATEHYLHRSLCT